MSERSKMNASYKLVRGLAIESLGSKCEKCESTIDLEIHHKDRNWRNSDRSNLELLCRSCHVGKTYRFSTINVPFDDEEINQLQKKKGDLSWHDFIIKLAEKK